MSHIFRILRIFKITCVAAAGSLAIFLADFLADWGKETTIEDGEDSVDSITDGDNDGNAGKGLSEGVLCSASSCFKDSICRRLNSNFSLRDSRHRSRRFLIVVSLVSSAANAVFAGLGKFESAIILDRFTQAKTRCTVMEDHE